MTLVSVVIVTLIIKLEPN